MKYAKAIVGAIVAGLVAAKTSIADGLTAGEIIEIALASLIALGAVWAVPNAPA